MSAVADLITALGDFPTDWRVRGCSSGRSIEVFAPDSSQWAYLMISGDEVQIRHYRNRVTDSPR